MISPFCFTVFDDIINAIAHIAGELDQKMHESHHGPLLAAFKYSATEAELRDCVIRLN